MLVQWVFYPLGVGGLSGSQGVRDRKVDKHETGLPHLRAACCSEYELQHDKSQTLGLSTQNTKYPKPCLKKNSDQPRLQFSAKGEKEIKIQFMLYRRQ